MASLLSYALTNVADVKESLGISSGDNTKNNLIIRKINQATRQIEAYCGRRFALTTYTQEIYGSPNIDQIVLRNRPIVSLTSLEVRDTSLNSDDFETVESTLYFADNSSGVLDLDFRAVGRWGRYRVTYSAGYTTIPEDLAEACASLAAYYVSYPDGSNAYVQEKREGQRQVRFHQTAKSFNILIQELGLDVTLDYYSNYPVMTDR